MIWYNKHIKINDRHVYHKTMFERGVVFVKDLFDSDGKCLKYAEIINRYGKCISHFDYIKLIDAIPAQWRKLRKQEYINTNNIQSYKMKAPLLKSIPYQRMLTKSLLKKYTGFLTKQL